MSNMTKYPLSLNGDTFNAFKSDFDQMLRQLLTEMEKQESEEATISVKMTVKLEPDQARDFQANGYDAMRDITKPSFKHDISTVLQVKQKKSGSLGGNMELVWDRELCQYIMRPIDNGQVSMFDTDREQTDQPDEGTPVQEALPAAGPLPLPPGDDVIDVDYVEAVDDESGDGDQTDGDGTDNSDGGTAPQTRFEWLRQFAGQELSITEAMGNYSVRTLDNRIVLSSAMLGGCKCCSPSQLKAHEGHRIRCYAYVDDDLVCGEVAIKCEECDTTILAVNAPRCDDGIPTDYQYEDPDEQAGEEE